MKNKYTLLLLILVSTFSSAATNIYKLVDSTWFGDNITKETFKTTMLPEMTNSSSSHTEVSLYAYPDEWAIKITDAGSYTPTSNTTEPYKDVLSLLSPSQGTWRSYKVQAIPEARPGEYGTEDTNVTFRVLDPAGCVASFQNNIITSSGTPGVATVIGTDTNNFSHETSFVMSKVTPGSVLKQFAYEGDGTTRFIWSSAVYAKFAAISDNNTVNHIDCRSWDHLYKEHSNATEDNRYIYRVLSRFGVNGTVTSEGWDLTGSKSPQSPVNPKCVNSLFFWPALHDNLRCFSISCHESARNWTQWYIPYILVAPHYAVTAYHYGGIGYGPTFQTSSFSQTFERLTNDKKTDLGMIKADDGSSTDLRLVRLGTAFPQEICAKFATKEVLQKLSISSFNYTIGLTLTSHQTVQPVCTTTYSTSYSWVQEPNESDRKSTYIDKQTATMNDDLLAKHEHPCHMYESGSPVFFVNPNGKVVPLFCFHFASGGSGGGSSYLDVLSTLDNAIRKDSSGTEQLQYWSFEDLYTGGTNSLEVITQ